MKEITLEDKIDWVIHNVELEGYEAIEITNQKFKHEVIEDEQENENNS